VICGTASVANWDPPPLGPRVERHLLVKRARMSGFWCSINDSLRGSVSSVWPHGVARRPNSLSRDIADGIERCPGAIAELYRGENLGKRLIRLRRHDSGSLIAVDARRRNPLYGYKTYIIVFAMDRRRRDFAARCARTLSRKRRLAGNRTDEANGHL